MSSTDTNDWTIVSHKKDKLSSKSPNNQAISTSYDEGSNYPSFNSQDWKEITFSSKPKIHTTFKNLFKKKGPTNTQLNLNFIDNQTEPFKLKKVNKNLSKKMIEYRKIHNLTQIDLAMKLNVKLDIVNSYEKGTAIPDEIILNKIYRIINQSN